MNTPQLPEQLLFVRKFIQENELTDLDFFVNERAKWPPLLKEEMKNEVMPAGSNKAGCYVCLVRINNIPEPDNWPLAWLDSEGQPNEWIAENISRFLQILPYGTGWVYDALSTISRHRQYPEMYPSPETLFSTSEMQAVLKDKTEANKKILSFIEAVKDKYSIDVSENPLEIILQAQKRYNNTLLHWYHCWQTMNRKAICIVQKC